MSGTAVLVFYLYTCFCAVLNHFHEVNSRLGIHSLSANALVNTLKAYGLVLCGHVYVRRNNQF